MSDDIIRQLEESWAGSGLEDPKYTGKVEEFFPDDDSPMYGIRLALRTITSEGVVQRISRVVPWNTPNKVEIREVVWFLIHDNNFALAMLSNWSPDLNLPDELTWECLGVKIIQLAEVPF